MVFLSLKLLFEGPPLPQLTFNNFLLPLRITRIDWFASLPTANGMLRKSCASASSPVLNIYVGSCLRLKLSMAGKTAIVTGPTSGIGTWIAHKVAAAGAQVILAARDVNKAEKLKHDITKAGGDAKVEHLVRALAFLLTHHFGTTLWASLFFFFFCN